MDAIRFAVDAIHALGKLQLTLERNDMITELSWFHWSRGDRERATAALGAAVDYLISNVNADSERFRESFRKTAYVVGWMASTARGERPKDPVNDADLRSPYVGFASRSRPAFASVDLPLLPPALLYMQARLEAAIGFRFRALLHCRQSRAGWRASDLDVAECVAASAQGELAASIGKIDEAVEAGLLGIRHFILDEQAGSGDTFRRKGIETAWASASLADKASLERLLFSKAVAASLVGALMRRLSPLQIVGVIGQLRDALTRYGVAEPSYWHDLLTLAEMHFDATAPLAAIGQAIVANQGNREHLVILYLALINRPDAAPRDICVAELVCLSTFRKWERTARSPLVDFARIVQQTWRGIAKDRALLLNTPRLLRETLDEYTTPTVANAARILVVAQAATGLRLDTPSLMFLNETSRLSF